MSIMCWTVHQWGLAFYHVLDCTLVMISHLSCVGLYLSEDQLSIMCCNLLSCVHVLVKSRKPFFSEGAEKGCPLLSLCFFTTNCVCHIAEARQAFRLSQLLARPGFHNLGFVFVVDFLVLLLRSFSRHLLNTSLPLCEMILSQIYVHVCRNYCVSMLSCIN